MNFGEVREMWNYFVMKDIKYMIYYVDKVLIKIDNWNYIVIVELIELKFK